MTDTEPEVAETTREDRATNFRLRPLGAHTDRKIRRLQREYLAGTSSSARALLAHLRNSVGKTPGADPRIWEVTLAGMPGPAARSDEPTFSERAAHAAMTLWAWHQQARTEPMHQQGVGLGTAVWRLGSTTGNADAVRRRFDAVATATSFEEAVHHLRALIGQLRSARIPLDYGRLTDDLHTFQFPDGPDRVRLNWGRQFYNINPNDESTTASITAEEAS